MVEFMYLVFTRMPGESYHVVLVTYFERSLTALCVDSSRRSNNNNNQYCLPDNDTASLGVMYPLVSVISEDHCQH